MSLLRYFKPVVENAEDHHMPGLPDPQVCKTTRDKRSFTSANQSVIAASTAVDSRKRKRGPYSAYNDELRCKIGKYAAENGTIAAVRKFSDGREKLLNESTVRGMKTSYIQAYKSCHSKELATLPGKLRGVKPVLGNLDDDVRAYIVELREGGGVINSRICIAAALGIVRATKPTLLPEFGGTLVLDRPWARSFLNRIGFVKRKATKTARNFPNDFEGAKKKFLQTIDEKRNHFSIPDDLVLNWDQTGVKLVPASKWTMEARGSKQVGVVGLDDKREITVLMTTTLSGKLLPPQVLYAGKTDRCHAKVTFPNDWDVWHSDNRWSNEATMLRFVDTVLLPYVETCRSRVSGASQHALCIFDIFAAHRTKSLLQKLAANNIEYVFVPASCTGLLQPNDLNINNVFKTAMMNRFTQWYAGCVQEVVEKGQSAADVKIDLRASVMKPVHAAWLIEVYADLENRRDTIRIGYTLAGIV